MRGNESLTPKQELFIDKLLSGSAITDAAKECKIVEATAHRWLKDSTFQQVYSERRQQVFSHSLTTLQLKFDKAVETLDRHTSSIKTIPRDQIRAAEVIVGTTLQTAKLVERITELEARLAEQEQNEMYQVKFDLRQLTKEEREALEAIHDRIRTSAIENA